ncbi:inosine/xanthosine triphosphatase [Archaeoglobus sp.]
MKVVVGSTNPTKVEGAKLAFEQYFEDVEVESVEIKTTVSPQPFDDDTIKGAIERAVKCYSAEFDFSVGIEAGLFRFEGTISGYIDFQVAAIYNGQVYTLGFGPGFEYPKSVVDEVMKGKEVGEVMSRLSGIENLGRKVGAVHYLSKGKISRSELSRLAVTMALIPWLNRELYYESNP